MFPCLATGSPSAHRFCHWSPASPSPRNFPHTHTSSGNPPQHNTLQCQTPAPRRRHRRGRHSADVCNFVLFFPAQFFTPLYTTTSNNRHSADTLAHTIEFYFFLSVFNTGKTHFYLVPGTHNTCFLPASLFLFIFSKGRNKARLCVYICFFFFLGTNTHACTPVLGVGCHISVCNTTKTQSPHAHARPRVIVAVVRLRRRSWRDVLFSSSGSKLARADVVYPIIRDNLSQINCHYSEVIVVSGGTD